MKTLLKKAVWDKLFHPPPPNRITALMKMRKKIILGTKLSATQISSEKHLVVLQI